MGLTEVQQGYGSRSWILTSNSTLRWREVHEWWYHGLVTLGHDTISSYNEFTQRLMERLDKKDPKINFRELAQLKQTGTAEAFISEFQRIVVMETDVSKCRLIMLFSEALTEPLQGWVKAYKPSTL